MASRPCELGRDAAAALATAGLSAVGDQLRGVCVASAAAAAGVAKLADATNSMFLLFAGALIFQMQLGFALLVTGAVRNKSAASVMLLHVVAPCVVGLCYFLFGFAMAFGSTPDANNPVIGSTFWALQPRDAFDSFSGSVSLALVWFQFTFATICATILLGAVSERATFVASIFSMVVVGGLAFPTVSHWLWSEYGWLSYGKLSGRLFGSGAFDLAGSGVVHVTGGAAALIAVILVGPRVGRYDEATRDSFSAHNVTLVCQGTFVLWAGFVVFNSSSVMVITESFVAAGRCLINTLLAGCTGGLTMLAISRLVSSHYSVLDVMNGVLAGLVGICSSCSIVLPYSAILTGSVCSLIFFFCEKAMLRFQIDDPVSAASLHLGAGIGGLLLTGFTAYPPYLRDAFPGRDSYPGGLFYGGDAPGALLGAQVVATISIIALVCLLLTPVLLGLKLCGVLVYSEEEQLMGADEAIHGGAAYNFNAEETSADLLTTWQASTTQLSPRPLGGGVGPLTWSAPAEPVDAVKGGGARRGSQLDVSSSFTAAAASGDAAADGDQGHAVVGPRYASFAVTTDSGHRSATRRQHVGSASALGVSSSRDTTTIISSADDPDDVEAVAPVSTNFRSSF